MICLRCTLRISLRPLRSETISLSTSTGPLSTLRPFTTSPHNHANSNTPTQPQSPTQTPSRPNTTSTPATPSSSTPVNPSPSNTRNTHDASAEGSHKSHAPTVMSSVPAGTPLKGLNYLKNRSDPIAMEDHEYPDWLWNVLSDQGKKAAGSKEEIDPRIYSKSANARRKANKRARATNQDSQGVAEKVPLYAQSIDLPSGDGTAKGAAEALDAREDLTRAMRGKRRKDIKEANFLKGMR